jgi:hypothetical protein
MLIGLKQWGGGVVVCFIALLQDLNIGRFPTLQEVT